MIYEKQNRPSPLFAGDSIPTPPQQSRIDGLIQDLEEVFVRQGGQPAYPDLREHPIIQALISEGEGAVKPLLACLESDTRLTRTVYFHRNFFRARKLIGVHEAAYAAKSAIFKTQFFERFELARNLYSQNMEGRLQVVAKIREYVQLSPVQRKRYQPKHKFKKSL